jgi:hypothetical protein
MLQDKFNYADCNGEFEAVFDVDSYTLKKLKDILMENSPEANQANWNPP